MVCLSFQAVAVERAGHSRRHRFKNLPVISSTPSGVLHASQEFNIFAGSAFSNTTVDYGHAGGWNIGLSLLNVALYEESGNHGWNPDILLNVEKAFQLNANMAVLLGTQNGAAFWDQQRSGGVESYTYADFQFNSRLAGMQFHLGGYIASRVMSGPGDQFGFLAGSQFPLWRDRVSLSLDYISGSNALGAASILMLWRISRQWRIDLGAQLPAPGSANDYGALLGFAWQP